MKLTPLWSKNKLVCGSAGTSIMRGFSNHAKLHREVDDGRLL
jgi:hypothetical protein